MAAHQAPPSLGFSRQEHWSGLPLPSPNELPTYSQKTSNFCPHDAKALHELSPHLCSYCFTALTIFPRSQNMPDSCLPQGLCTCYSRCQDTRFPSSSHGPPLSSLGLSSDIASLKKSSPTTSSKHPPNTHKLSYLSVLLPF